MTMRGFLLCYLGTVMVVGAAGAGTYHTLVQRHAATEAATAQPVAVAEAAPPDTPQVASVMPSASVFRRVVTLVVLPDE